VKALSDRWKTVHRVCVDQTGVGEYITEDMKNAGIQNVEGVMFTEQRKEELATALKEKMLRDEFKLPYDRALINELNVERYELTKTGRIKFTHPEGSHDDRFWATALAVYACTSGLKSSPIIARTF
jgi:phage FluMu gp28-like protein